MSISLISEKSEALHPESYLAPENSQDPTKAGKMFKGKQQ
jgi:hypothetical protein